MVFIDCVTLATPGFLLSCSQGYSLGPEARDSLDYGASLFQVEPKPLFHPEFESAEGPAGLIIHRLHF